jgi:hypothetical protein
MVGIGGESVAAGRKWGDLPLKADHARSSPRCHASRSTNWPVRCTAARPTPG